MLSNEMNVGVGCDIELATRKRNYCSFYRTAFVLALSPTEIFAHSVLSTLLNTFAASVDWNKGSATNYVLFFVLLHLVTQYTFIINKIQGGW